MLNNQAPMGNGHGPFEGNIVGKQVHQFEQSGIGRENAFVFSVLADLAMISFNGIVGRNGFSNSSRKVKTSRKFSPIVMPGTNDHGVFFLPTLG